MQRIQEKELKFNYIFTIIWKSDEKRVVVNPLIYREFMVGANEQINFTNLLLER